MGLRIVNGWRADAQDPCNLMEVPRTEHESSQSLLWNLGNRGRGLNKLDVPLLQPTIGANSIVVTVKEQMRATESLGNEALAFKQSLCLHPKHLVPDMVTLPRAESCSSRAFCMQNSLSQSLMPDYSDHPLSIFLLTNYIHNFFGLVKSLLNAQSCCKVKLQFQCA